MQEQVQEQVQEIQVEVQGLPGGLHTTADDAGAGGVDAEGGAHHGQGDRQAHANAGVV